ncbi:MAG: NAD-dependent epimerase/dehydratase family protein [Chitinophagaceae bacterium]
MKILITGVAGFVGSCMAKYFRGHFSNIEIIGIDNLSRRGSEYNLQALKELDCRFYHGDIRNKEDVEDLPKVDWIIDCAAIPTVTAGVHSGTLSLINNNLTGTLYLLEKCRRDQAGFVILSTSRVYSINELNKLPLLETATRLAIHKAPAYPKGFSEKGIAEEFSTAAPVSLYGATKLSSEIMALEYHYTFGFPVWINRCGVIAGPGQFGKIDQGVFSFWVYQYLLGKPLSFIGFGGKGKQVRDFIHPYDVFRLIRLQVEHPSSSSPRLLNIGGGIECAMSLAELDIFCKQYFNTNKPISEISETRGFDIPLYISDYAKAKQYWQWQPSLSSQQILEQIAEYGSENLEQIRSIS